LAEQTATINDAGQFVNAGGAGASWSDAFSYDTRSNLVKRVDTRGVVTNYDYQLNGVPDPLNRLQSLSYDKTGADTSNPIAGVASVLMEYMSTGDKTRVSRITTTNIAAEDYYYDNYGRKNGYQVTLAGSPTNLIKTNFFFDTVNRLTEIQYPNQYGTTNSQRKTVGLFYDQASRLAEVQVQLNTHLSEIVYNPMSQITQAKTGAASGNADIETYGYDNQTGLLTNQIVSKANTGQQLLNLSYGYNRGNSNGSLNGKTGQLTQIVDNRDGNKNRIYDFDTLGRLKTAKGGAAAGAVGAAANWTQNYSYDRYGNRETVMASGITANSIAVPTDGIPTLSYNRPSNRINTLGYEYDLAGNQTRGQNQSGQWLRYEYDAAGRLVSVKNDVGNPITSNTYGSSRQRLYALDHATGEYTIYAWGGSSVLAEYTAQSSNVALFNWRKSYFYAGRRLLSTISNNGQGGEVTEFHHPDRLGTKLVTNNSANISFEQSTLPFGTYLSAESSGATNQVFTSYDRSAYTGLDYAVNRTYNSGQSRFTQVDPLGLGAISFDNPQSLNMYAYVQNNPIDFIDPLGLYEACIHQTMTAFLGRAAGLSAEVADKIAYYTGDGKGGADSDEFAATSAKNFAKCQIGRGPSVTTHFPNAGQLAANKHNYKFYMSKEDYQNAGFMIHSIEDAVGAHFGYSNVGCLGHATDLATLSNPHDTDRLIGDSKFINAANQVLQAMSGNLTAKLTPTQVKDLIKAIKDACGDKFPLKIEEPQVSSNGGGGGGGGNEEGGNISRDYDPFRSLEWLLFMSWVEQNRRAEQDRRRM
jgi:RHS repeat-associated protein